jgi:hypothetical protein
MRVTDGSFERFVQKIALFGAAFGEQERKDQFGIYGKKLKVLLDTQTLYTSNPNVHHQSCIFLAIRFSSLPSSPRPQSPHLTLNQYMSVHPLAHLHPRCLPLPPRKISTHPKPEEQSHSDDIVKHKPHSRGMKPGRILQVGSCQLRSISYWQGIGGVDENGKDNDEDDDDEIGHGDAQKVFAVLSLVVYSMVW